MAYNSKYTGAELEKKLDAVNDIPNLIDAILLNKNYITEEALKCFMEDYAPSDYSNIPIDNNTIYWENGLLKSKGGTGGGSDNCGCLWELRESKTGGYYLYSKYHVASKYGMSMYIEEATSEDGSGFIPDYVADLPIDNDTIYWSVNSLGNPILKAKVGTGGSEGNNSEFSKLFKGHYDEAGDLIYIEALSDMIVNGGITIYAGNNVDVDSIYDGLPIDNNTIKWIETTNSDGSIIKLLGINPDIDLGGVSTWDELEGKPSWITTSKPKWDYEVDIYNRPNLSIYATLEYVNNEFKKYVTLDTDQTIKGFKDFEKGLSIGGLPITKSQDDVIYIDANLVVRGGITMYAEGEVNIPSIIDSLPIASTTAKGIASFDGTYFAVDSNGKVTLLAANVGLNEEELAAYLTEKKYATQSWVYSLGYASSSDLNALQTKVNDFLEGSDTDTIINKWRELEYFLNGLSESDNLATILGTKANQSDLDDTNDVVATKWTQDDIKIGNWDTAYKWGDHSKAGYALKSYVDDTFVTLATKQTITGEKNFTGGLKVNGSPIVYDATNKYWKLEGDLLVTGGVTMFASDSAFTPSTIMAAIATDGTNLKVVNGVLTFVGSIDGGEAGSVAWENVTGKPTFASVATSGKYSDLSGTPTLLSSFTDDVVAGNYLPLSGGTLLVKSLNGFTVKMDQSSVMSAIAFANTSRILGYIALNSGGPIYRTSSGTNYGLYHTGNFTPSDYLLASNYTASDILTKLLTVDGADSGLDADLLDGVERDSILELNQKGTARISAAGWYRIAKFQKTASQSNVCRLHLSRKYNTLNNEAYIFDITYTYHNRYSITQTTGVYESTSSRCLTKIRIDSVSSTSEYAYVDFYYSKGSANSVFWLSIGSLESFREPTLVEAPTGTSIEFETTKGCKSALGFEGSLTGNASTATQLQTPRTIWGQSFDGSGDVSGNLTVGDGEIYLNNELGIRVYDKNNSSYRVLHLSSSNNLIIGSGSSAKGYDTFVDGKNIKFRYGTSHITGMVLNSSGNMGIGIDSPAYKLDVNGDIHSTTNVRTPIATIDGIPIYKSQDDVLYIDGNLAVRGGITMYATDAIDVPSIIDALPIASASAKGIAAFNPNDFSVVDGYVSFIGSTGGVDESVLADYAKKTDLSAYLPLSGGQMTGSISYPLEYMGNIRDLASSCIFDYTDSLTAKGAIDNKRSLMGYAHNVTYDSWSNIISVRGDSDKYGMYIYSSMTEYGGSLYWNRQEGFEGAWQGVRVILDSVNWSQYVKAGDGGNYLPLTGGTIDGRSGSYTPLNIYSNHNQGIIIYGNATETTINYNSQLYGTSWTTGINIKNELPNSYCIYSTTKNENVLKFRGSDGRGFVKFGLEFENTGLTTYNTNGITIGSGDAAERYITCYGKNVGYINIGKSPSIGNTGELAFHYY